MNITYLLGAGASAEAIPVLADLAEDFTATINDLNKFRKAMLNPQALSEMPLYIKEHNNIIDIIIEELTWLTKETQDHMTVDTLAKKYYLQGDDSLRRLKRILIFYFHYKQIGKRADLRYDSFIASISRPAQGKTIRLLEDIKVLTWNYDLQFEITLKNYVNKSIQEIKREYQIHPQVPSKEDPTKSIFNFSNFGIIKLNGNAFLSNTESENANCCIDKCYKKEYQEKFLLDALLHDFKLIFYNSYNSFHLSKYFNFSWESDDSFIDKHPAYSENQQTAFTIAENTDILVVIGYSFPVFNRTLDTFLINRMTNLKKVYILDTNPEIIQSTMHSAFYLFDSQFSKPNGHGIEFQLNNNIRQFPIPFELII